MSEPIKTIAVIPARGGSKGIPRKNLRPINDKPLIFYSIKACLDAKTIDRVVVSTDDEEIALIAKRFGAQVILRDNSLSDDLATLDPVIEHAADAAEKLFSESYSHVVTVQPTSPLVTAEDINSVVSILLESSANTVLTAVDDRHLCWTKEGERYVPVYKNRVNRQQLAENYKETGSVLACTREQCRSGTRIGKNIELSIVPHERSFDIDTFADLYLCEALLKRKHIVFVVTGYSEVGLGHAYRSLLLANEMVTSRVTFLLEKRSELAAKYINNYNYQVVMCENGELLRTLSSMNPDLIVNDILDTSEEYMTELSKLGCKIVNFEDSSLASKKADLVINALYPQQNSTGTVLTGEKYFCLRDEFIYLDKVKRKNRVERVLITFGGVDEGNVTHRVLEIISSYCKSKNIEVDVVIGPGYKYKDSIDFIRDTHINIVSQTNSISEYMSNADLAITSGGRTVLELASIEIPTIVICQNQRETTHTFASEKNGVLNLGHRDSVSDSNILSCFIELVENSDKRQEISNLLSQLDLRNGKKRVIKLLKSFL
ncbi:glycosyltransferase [uncultured Ferrimonas sp.]|uniref:cytidylyltransferase domain-containing protein n=1 Tax=uncultured Ferrimonas sp. TaxID=432640 RepID=UPI0026033149|nr:glycosyltransferase [uncultured Ferrimonas sp.]